MKLFSKKNLNSTLIVGGVILLFIILMRFTSEGFANYYPNGSIVLIDSSCPHGSHATTYNSETKRTTCIYDSCYPDSVMDKNGNCMCVSGYKMVDGKCQPNIPQTGFASPAGCMDNATRNKEGQCACNSGYRLAVKNDVVTCEQMFGP